MSNSGEKLLKTNYSCPKRITRPTKGPPRQRRGLRSIPLVDSKVMAKSL